MTAKLIELKDRTPNQDTIQLLEELLEDARAGEVRSVVVVAAYEDGAPSRNWSLDERTCLWPLLGRMSVAMTELQALVASGDKNSPFAHLNT